MGHLWARQGGGKRRKKASKKERAGRKNVLTNKWSETNIVQEAKGARKSFQSLKNYIKKIYILARTWRYSRAKKRTEGEGTKNEKVEERKGWEERWAEKWEIRKKKKMIGEIHAEKTSCERGETERSGVL